MSASLADLELPADGSSLVVAVAIGLAFGVALERAGLGSARKLMGQFLLTDLTVLKVMLSAIVTAMLGAFWLARLGILDPSRLYVPPTFLLPQLAGGLVFGAGFVIAGLCPGTSCIAAATGRLDGLAAVIGIFAGVLAASLLATPLRDLYESTPRGAWTLPDLLRVPEGVVVFAVTAVALSAFRGAEWVERRAR